MNSADYVQGNRSNTLRYLASKWGFSCCEDERGNWRIQPQADERQWYLQQSCERWLLVVNDVPQISFQASEASDFIQRWLGAQDD